jgi:acetate kinase
MSSVKQRILTINSGSSSIKFALFLVGEVLVRELYGKIDRIGLIGTMLTFNDLVKKQRENFNIGDLDHHSAAIFLMDWLAKQIDFTSVLAVGHRVVHGMKHTEPQLVNQLLIEDLYSILPYDPDHMPSEIHLIEAFIRYHPHLTQVACFDTAFHREMPRVAKLLAIPRRYEEKGVQRYGFHGLSYTYLMEELAQLNDTEGNAGRIILAHLGNGASMTAVLNGKSIDTSMSFTPASGLPMSTRSGDIDPGLVTYLMRMEKMTEAQFHKMTNRESGLLGISGVSSDMRDLLDNENSNPAAADAIALFCYQVKKQIGAYSAALGGLDVLVFAGGIGESSPIIRKRVCDGLEFLGIELDQESNTKNAPLISKDVCNVKVRVIATDEELMIARSVTRVLNLETIHESETQ